MSTTLAKSKAHLYRCCTNKGEARIMAGHGGEFNLPCSKFFSEDAKEQVRMVQGRSYLQEAYSTIAFVFVQPYFSGCMRFELNMVLRI